MSTELALLGADTANQQAGAPSMYDKVKMFAGSSVLSGWASLYNTGVEYYNKFGGEAEKLDVSRTLEHYDQNWYSYYKDNSQLIDVAGFIGTSLVPGTLAIKGLKAVQAGNASGAVGRAVQGPLNFALSRRDKYLEAGLKEIATTGSSAYSYINANKWASIGWGTADQVLQATAFEIAVAMTMNQSPILADRNKGEILSDIAFGAMVGGAFGGALDSLATSRIFKDAVKGLDAKQRNYDVLPTYSGQHLSIGDEAFGIVDSWFKLPKEVTDHFITVRNSLNKKDVELDIEKTLKRALKDTERSAITTIQQTLQKLGTKETPEVGQQTSEMIFKMIADLKAGGSPDAHIKQEVGNYLLGLDSVSTLKNTDAFTLGKDDFFLADRIDVTKLKNGTDKIEDLLALAKSRTPFEKNATSKPYQLIGDISELKFSATHENFKLAWRDGMDMAIIGDRLRVNPASTIFRQVRDPALIPSRYLNTRTAGVSDTVVETWADLLPRGAQAADSLLVDGVLNGDKALKVADNFLTDNAYTATARHAWATRLKLNDFADTVVDVRDISRLERLAQLAPDSHALPEDFGLQVRLRNGDLEDVANLDLRQTLTDEKLERLQELLDSPELMDPRAIAYILNTSESWMERAMANGFTRLPEDDLVASSWRPLEEYLQRENFIARWASPKSLVELRVTTPETYEKAMEVANSKGATYLDSFITGEIGFVNRVEISDTARNNAFGNVFGEDALKFVDINDATALARQADSLGAGASMLGFANASYGEKLRMATQTIGKLTNQLIGKTAEINLNKITPFIHQFQENRVAGAELGTILTMLRRNASHFVFASDGQAEKLVVRELTTVDELGQRVINPTKLSDWLTANPGKQAAFEIESPLVMDYLKVWRDVNGERIQKRKALINANGGTLGWDPEVIYAPPIDTKKYPFFAYVKQQDGTLGGTSDVGMLTARSEKDLQELANSVPGKYQVYFKKDTEEYFKVKNEYDHQLAFNEPRVNSQLQKEGKLGDLFYETRSENVMEDFITYSQHADAALVRLGVETKYAQLFAELRGLGEQFTNVATSKASGGSKYFDKSAVNPFTDYIKTALDISKRSSFPLLSSLNEFVDSAGTRAYRILTENTEKARAGLISWQEAERLGTKYGIGGVYNPDNVDVAYRIANNPMDRNIIRETVSKVNSTLATVGLRLDFANSLVNIISMPIMLGTELQSLKALAKTDPKALGALNELITINPSGSVPVPSYSMVIGRAISNILGKDGKQLIEGYREAGDVKNVMLQFYESMGELAINPMRPAKEWSKGVDATIEKMAKWTGNTFSEDFTRAVSANIMDQLTQPLIAAGKLSKQEADAYRSVFVNRVNGNYIASQRPIVFQGTVGAAVSLFQTYIFNVMQQLTRHIEDRNTRAIMTMGGLQGALYGLNGLPFFEAVNTHIIGNAAINDGHRDVYSATTELAGKELGNFLMYGTVSAFPLWGDKSPALYTRGDLNPRHPTIIPVLPTDIPAVSVAIKAGTNLWNMGTKMVAGADLSSALLEGLEHNGISRPLAGLAQLAHGATLGAYGGVTTTGKGSLISASNEFNTTLVATRVLGARPMDEAIGLNTMFRVNAYKAADLERLSKLGAVVKTKLLGNQMPEPEEMNEFMKNYARAGGNLQNYSRALQGWSKDANMSVVEQMKRYHTSSYAQRLTEIMGGTTLEDFASGPAVAQEQ